VHRLAAAGCQFAKLLFMRRPILVIVALLVFITARSQKTEIRAGFSSGLFSFSGSSATSHSFFNYSQSLGITYTNDPYGSNEGFSYGLVADMQRIAKNNFIMGFGLAWEKLRSKQLIDAVSGYSTNNAKGTTYLEFNFINTNPFAGYRIHSGAVSIDIVGGFDIAFCVKAREEGKATASDGKAFRSSLDRKTITTDIRPRIQAATTYKRTGIYFGYSIGLPDYMKNYIGGNPDAHSRLLRFGITYQLK
jgi:hypothetical protein